MFARFFNFVEKAIPLSAGIIFAVFGILVAANLPEGSSRIVGGYLAFLLFHTAAMLIVGMYLNQYKRFLAISWCVALALFFVVAVIFK